MRETIISIIILLAVVGSEVVYSLSSSATTKTTKTSASRRTFLVATTTPTASVGIAPSIANSIIVDVEEEKNNKIDRGGKPYAPLEALLPVTRLKLWFEDVYTLSSKLAQESSDNNNNRMIVTQMNFLLSSKEGNPKLFDSKNNNEKKLTKVTSPSTSGTTAQLTSNVSSVTKDQYQKNRKDLNNIGDKVAAMLNQADVERQWGILQYAESKREESNEMRAAFNFYTKQITFGDNYVLTANKEERKQMIRNDALPTLAAVIVSDLDRRDLYRNQFLTYIEDARAEVAYQVKQDVIDVTDIVVLVNEANDAFENWFSLIAPVDINEAREKLQGK
eukprot:CAMPEP_0178955978 /NCGR_PEP_ID=MMETSP0789-20121207/9938_1 /TAXON_ID=3005 /ORGANISM="Rhizosolenia setigera, Strain CCMP 1694" /LENGTH=332 /DNA_ID=CAMNT_0020637735 /DNA_START=112 /DNA_END=1110 /DNA_ORIENTATION=+